MTNQPANQPPSTPQHPPNAGAQPLWLPAGSIRSLLAIAIVAVWATLELGLAGGPIGHAPDTVRTMAIAVAAGYGLLRHWQQHRTPPTTTTTNPDQHNPKGNPS